MSFPGTFRHIPLLSLFAVALAGPGCSSSHSGSGPGGGDGGPGGSDAGRTDSGATCGAIDPGLCRGGPCCDDEVYADIDLDTCTSHCPAGYTWAESCEPDPAARCAPSWRTCDLNADCTLAANGCCGPCGEPMLSDYDAINPVYADEHRAAVCADPVPCPDCAIMPNPNLGATCTGGLCAGFDVRAMDLSACTTDDECRLRVADCCECGGDTSPYSLIAIRPDADADYQALVCDDVACAECAPVYPTDSVEAYCAADGHCDVRMLVAGG